MLPPPGCVGTFRPHVAVLFRRALLPNESPLLRFSSRGTVVGEATSEVDSDYYHIVVRIHFGRGCGLGVVLLHCALYLSVPTGKVCSLCA